MPKENNVLEVRGKIEELLPGATFSVVLENGHHIIAYLSGKMRTNRIRLGVGDDVTVVLSPYDLTKGRITFRL